jgi:LacI family transcriptional regulator
MGFDNVNFAHYTHPKLTTIVYPIGDIAQMAARWVLRHVYHDTSMAALQAVFEPKLIERDSTQGA